MREQHEYLTQHEFNGKRYRFEFKCGFMGTVDYIVSDETGTYRASLRHRLGNYERSILNVASDPEYPAKVESEIGILRKSAGSDAGLIPADTLAAFNEWRASEHARALAFMHRHPERYGDDFSDAAFAPPVPAERGRFNTETHYWERMA